VGALIVIASKLASNEPTTNGQVKNTSAKARKEIRKMKKQTLLSILDTQKQLTKKNTRQDIISVVSKLVDYHIKDNAEINGISPNRSTTGVNLGEVVEVIIKSKFRNKLTKDNKDYDATINGKRVEIKFSTSDSYAHATNTNNKVDYYLIATYTKKEGGKIFRIPTAKEIEVNNQGRAITDQKAKYLDKELTKEIFGKIDL
jgi:hypothetical protein